MLLLVLLRLFLRFISRKVCLRAQKFTLEHPTKAGLWVLYTLPPIYTFEVFNKSTQPSCSLLKSWLVLLLNFFEVRHSHDNLLEFVYI